MKTQGPLSRFKLVAIITTWILFGHISAANAQGPMCSRIFHIPAKPDPGANFLLQKKQPDHTAPQVARAVKIEKQQSGKNLTKPVEKIQVWVNRYESWFKKHQNNPRAQALIIEAFQKEFVIKAADIPESYYDLQVRIFRETGRGDISLKKEHKEYLAQMVIADQRQTLKPWIEHIFFSPDMAEQPMWVKIWAFQGITKLAKYDFETGTYAIRSKGQTAPFPSFDKFALDSTIEAVVAKVNGQPLDKVTDPIILEQLNGANFGKLFGRHVFIEQNRKLETLTIEGQWRKFPKGSNPMPLVESLACKNTGWCTAASVDTARFQLKGGDFYVYYSKNENGQSTEPRIAIRMEGDRIGEIRGIAENQNLDSKISKSNILETKLREFGEEGIRYQKRNQDMKMLTLIEQKHLKALALTKEETSFLWELHDTISGFGNQRDPRIEVIRNQRDFKKDISAVTGLPESQITSDPTDVLRREINFFKGNLKLDLNETPDVHIPKYTTGELEIKYIPVKGLDLREVEARGGFRLWGEIGAVQFNKIVSSDIVLYTGTRDTIKLPEVKINGNLSIVYPKNEAKTAEPHLIMPREVTGHAQIYHVYGAKNIVFPEIVGSFLLVDIKTTKGLQLETIAGEGYYFKHLGKIAEMALKAKLAIKNKIRDSFYVP